MVKFELPAATELASKNGGDAAKKVKENPPPLKADATVQLTQQQATEHLLRFFPALQQQLLAQHYFVRTCKDIEREICVNNVLDAANQSRCNALIALLHKNLTNDSMRQQQQHAICNGGDRPLGGILKPVMNNCGDDGAAGTAKQRKPKFFLRYKYSIPSGGGNAGSDSSSDTATTADDSVVRYTRKQLFNIGQNSASKVQPKCLETNRFFNIRKDMKRSVTGAPNERESSSRDPKERLRKENDGIVLSPQRRSFHMGCQMPSAPSTGNPPQIGAPNLIRGERNDLLNPSRERRFGSGRILPRDVSWDYRPSGGDKDKSVLGEPQSSSDYGGSGGYRNSSSASGGRSENYRGNDRDGNNDRYDRYDRRSYGRGEYDRNNDKENQPSRGSGNDRNNRIVSRFQSMGGEQSDKEQRGSNSRYNNSDYHHGGGGGGGYNNRRRLHSGDEEPEWFSGGPTSQHDTIELRGFDDPLHEEAAPEKSSGSKKRSDDSLSDEMPPPNRRSSNQGQGDSNKEEERAHEERAPAAKQDQDANEARPSTPPARSTPTKLNDSNNNSNGEKVEERKKPMADGDVGGMGEDKVGENHNDFIEEFLKMDSISGLLVDDEFPNKEAGGGSRFSRWFRRDSPSGMMGGGPPAHMQQMGGGAMQHFDSPRHALHDELNNMVNDFPPMIMIPGGNAGGNNDSNKYFAPISPAANTNNSLLEMLQRGGNSGGANMGDEIKQQNQLLSQMFGLQQQQQQSSSQMPSVEELEARLRGPSDNNKHMRDHQMPPNQQQQPGQGPQHPPNQDMHAFKKLLAQMSDNPNANQHQQQQQANLIQLLNKQQPQNQEELKKVFPFMFQPQRSQSRIMPPAGIPINKQEPGQMVQPPQASFGGGNQPQQQQMPRNEVMQALMRTLGQQQPQQSHLQANPMDQCAEILKRPEAQTILNGLVNGEVNHFQLHQQMLSPNLSQRQREVIQAVLAVCKNSPRVGSPNLMIPPIGGAPIPIPPPIGSAGPNPPGMTGDMQPHLLFQHHAQKQQMRLSPLPNGAPQRIPSPRELQYHTQSIMQNALIRKKLEEQRENFRKRQEQQGGVAAPNVSVGQPPSNGTMASTTLASLVAGSVSMAPNQMTSSASNVNPTGPVAACIEKPAIASPTLAFTPTSVLRKMTAEKDTDSNAGGQQNSLASSMMASSASTSSLASSVSSHPSTINSGGNVMVSNGKNFPGGPQGNQAAQRINQQIVHMAQMRQQHQQQQQPQQGGGGGGGNVATPSNANMNWTLNQLMQMKPQGRPIVKGSGSQQPTNQIPMASNLEFQQQQQQFQRQKQQQQLQNQGIPQQQQQQQQLPPQMANNTPNMLMGGGGGNNQQPMPMNNQQQLQQLLQHRQQQQRAMQQFQWMQQQQQNQQGHMDSNRNVNTTTNAGGVAPMTAANLMNFNRDQLSPTSNQLARWFSPELLAKAKAGNLPTLNVEQTLSLEEFERSIQHSSATVHN